MPAALDLARDMARPAVRSMLLGSTALTRFGVNGVEAALALDFISSEYRTGNTATTFADAFTGTSPRLTYNPGSASSSQSTMVNSSGEIVWAPHNLLDYSEDFSQSLFQKDADVQVGTTNNDDPAGGNAATQINVSGSGRIYANTTSVEGFSSVYIKPGAFTNFKFAGFFIDLGVTPPTNSSPDGSIDVLPNNWFRVTVGYVGNRPFQIQAYPDDTYVTHTQSGDYQIYGAHVYRSDLGGMAPVPGAATGFETYVPTNGAAVYLPRVGHHVFNGSAWVNEGLLIESEARTNLVTHSNALAQQTGIRATLTDDVAASPDGQTTAGSIVDTAVSGDHRVDFGAISVTSGTTYTASFFFKPNGRDFARVQMGTGGFGTAYANFDLSNGSEGTITGISDTSITDAGNGWYRCSVSAAATATASTVMSVQLATADNTVTYTGDGTSGIYVYGAQLEAASTPSSYIPTSGSTVTRGGQSLTVPPAQFGWPEPEYISPELVDNNDFSLGDNGDWVVQADWSITGGAASKTTGTQNSLYQDLTGVSPDSLYEITFDVSNKSGGGVVVFFTGATVTTVSGNGLYTFIVKASATNSRISFQGQADTTVTIDNISVREIDPLSVSIQMDGRMTYADTDQAEEVVFLRWAQTVDNTEVELQLRTSAGRTGEPSFLQRNLGVAESVLGPTTTTYTPGILTPFNISSRHGSNFIRGAADGVLAPLSTTPTALPDLSSTDLQIAYDFMGTIGQFRQFAGDIGDTGLVTATNPSTEPTLSLTFNGTGGSYYNLSWSE